MTTTYYRQGNYMVIVGFTHTASFNLFSLGVYRIVWNAFSSSSYQRSLKPCLKFL